MYVHGDHAKVGLVSGAAPGAATGCTCWLGLRLGLGLGFGVGVGLGLANPSPHLSTLSHATEMPRLRSFVQ